MRRKKQRDYLVKTVRHDVETAISLDNGAGRIERDIRAFDQNENGFQQRVAADRTAFWCLVIFLGSVALYYVVEFFASGDIAEWLAHQVAPLFVGAQDATHASADTPVWLRRGAGFGFVTLMLGVTLLFKFVKSWFLHHLSQRRNVVEAEDHSTHWRLTSGIWLIQFVTVGYMAAIAALYVWLFGFAQERAAITAAIATEQTPIEFPQLGIKLDGGEVETDEAVGKKSQPAANEVKTGGKLSYATGVVYVCLWLLHGLVLLLPTEGFGHELPLAHFKRGAAGRKVESMREAEGRRLRDILERIHSVEGEEREILIREAQPVAARINEAARRQAMDVPPAPGVTTPTPEAEAPRGQASDDPDDGAAGAAQNHAPNNRPPTPAGNAAVPESEDVYDAIFGTRPT
jgi:hypothetical protein